MLYLLESLTDARGHTAEMVGLLPGRASMQEHLANLGVHSVLLPEGEMRGHTFHYSRLDMGIEPIAWSRGRRPGQPGEPIYRDGGLSASYMHLYFPSNPEAVARLLRPQTGPGA